MLTFVTSEGDTGIRASDENIIAIAESLKLNGIGFRIRIKRTPALRNHPGSGSFWDYMENWLFKEGTFIV